MEVEHIYLHIQTQNKRREDIKDYIDADRFG